MSDIKEQAILDALHWIWSWETQFARLRRSTKAEWQLNNERSHLKRRKVFSRTSLDEHLLLVVGRNVLRSVECLKKHLSKKLIKRIVPSETQEALKALKNLRDIYEHWDEQRESFQNPNIEKKRSGKAFSQKFPEGRPWSVSYDKDKNDWVMGGVLRLNKFTAQLSTLENHLLGCLQSQEN